MQLNLNDTKQCFDTKSEEVSSNDWVNSGYEESFTKQWIDVKDKEVISSNKSMWNKKYGNQ